MRRTIAAPRVLTDNGAIAMSGDGPVQVLIEVMAIVVVWAATLVFTQFGIEIDLTRPSAAREDRTVERTASPVAQPPAKAAREECPDAEKARVHRI
ncbi:MAG: hypothetical protein Q8L23_03095 [Caulobacter sp.]|nr:hypothetical protein [Caulobacter sp.]